MVEPHTFNVDHASSILVGVAIFLDNKNHRNQDGQYYTGPHADEWK